MNRTLKPSCGIKLFMRLVLVMMLLDSGFDINPVQNFEKGDAVFGRLCWPYLHVVNW